MQFLCEPYTATVMSMLPPICLVGSVAWCAVVPFICFHVVEWYQPDRVLRQFGMQQPIPEFPSQPQNIHGLTLKGKQDESISFRRSPTFSQYPSQMYQYPFEGHDTDMSASEHSFGGVAETHPHFSWPTMTFSQQHDASMETPNSPLAPQWNVPGAIPDMGDLLGVDLRHEFCAEAEQEGQRQRARRNPDRQARRWDRPCGTSSRHHRHHNE